MQIIPPSITRSELASHLGLSRTSLYRYLKKADLALPSGMICPKDVVRVCLHLGYPVPEIYKRLAERMRDEGEAINT